MLGFFRMNFDLSPLLLLSPKYSVYCKVCLKVSEHIHTSVREKESTVTCSFIYHIFSFIGKIIRCEYTHWLNRVIWQ